MINTFRIKTNTEIDSIILCLSCKRERGILKNRNVGYIVFDKFNSFHHFIFELIFVCRQWLGLGAICPTDADAFILTFTAAFKQIFIGTVSVKRARPLTQTF